MRLAGSGRRAKRVILLRVCGTTARAASFLPSPMYNPYTLVLKCVLVPGRMDGWGLLGEGRKESGGLAVLGQSAAHQRYPAVIAGMPAFAGPAAGPCGREPPRCSSGGGERTRGDRVRDDEAGTLRRRGHLYWGAGTGEGGQRCRRAVRRESGGGSGTPRSVAPAPVYSRGRGRSSPRDGSGGASGGTPHASGGTVTLAKPTVPCPRTQHTRRSRVCGPRRPRSGPPLAAGQRDRPSQCRHCRPCLIALCAIVIGRTTATFVTVGRATIRPVCVSRSHTAGGGRAAWSASSSEPGGRSDRRTPAAHAAPS